jgi:hypothetical protein
MKKSLTKKEHELLSIAFNICPRQFYQNIAYLKCKNSIKQFENMIDDLCCNFDLCGLFVGCRRYKNKHLCWGKVLNEYYIKYLKKQPR